MYTTGSDNVAYINQDAASAGKFEFKMRDSLKPGDNEQKEYTVMVGGTDVATAKTGTFTLGTASTGFEATFEDDEASVGDAIKGTTITLPALPTTNPTTRYYVGWTVDGTTVLKAGSEYTMTADTKFTAVHYAKGDVNQDEWVDYNDAGYIYLYEAEEYDIILNENCPKFWDDDDTNYILPIADVNQDEWVDYNDAGYIYLYEAEEYDIIENENCPKFWEE